MYRPRACPASPDIEHLPQALHWAPGCRPGFTLGGTGGGIAHDEAEFREIVRRGLEASLNHEVLIEESLLGWKEFEMEVMRDKILWAQVHS